MTERNDDGGGGGEWMEPGVNVPVFCSGVAHATVVSGEIHIAYFVEQSGPNGSERVINLRIVLPALALPNARAVIDQAVRANRDGWNG